jgi:hypothetical protein
LHHYLDVIEYTVGLAVAMKREETMRMNRILETATRGVLVLGLIAFLLSFGLASPPLSRAQAAVINEIRTNQPGADNDEYFELVGTPSTSLDGLTYLVIGDDASNSPGVIEEVTDLTGQTIPASGYFVAAESTFSLATADMTTGLNFEDESVTHMLVSGFTGSDGDDLDTDDDGTLDVTPWTTVEDCVAIVEAGGDLVYCATRVGPDGVFVPGQVYRCPSPTWVMGDWGLGPYDTPGAANACATAVTVASLDASSARLPVAALGLAAVLVGVVVVRRRW